MEVVKLVIEPENQGINLAKYLIHQAQEEMIYPKDLINLIQTTIVDKLYKKKL
ncbi:MAG: DUF2887 domain-containing protein [Trichodesmium sp. St19_bin1]|nr:DUF2887 domain-containing protein [Trichodesmium sp. St19_bin1]